jgi:hypothetical protein
MRSARNVVGMRILGRNTREQCRRSSDLPTTACSVRKIHRVRYRQYRQRSARSITGETYTGSTKRTSGSPA